MTFYCDGCHENKGYIDFKRASIGPNKGDKIQRFCRLCVHGNAYVPDCFFDGKPEENLADGPDGKPRVFLSKGEKANYLKSRGLQEAGDRVHGAPVCISKQTVPKIDSRHEVKMAMKKVQEMGSLARRQEYQRIVKEGQRHA